MDPAAALRLAFDNGATPAARMEARCAYNKWVKEGGFRAAVDLGPHEFLWMRGMKWGYVNVVTPNGVRIHNPQFSVPQVFVPWRSVVAVSVPLASG